MRDASSFDICISLLAFGFSTKIYEYYTWYMDDAKGRHKANKLICFEYKLFSFRMCCSIFIAIEFRHFLENSVVG